ncbi:MAG: 1-acyl-sn-glycerol-3-phosphate acyltransferase [Myxococcales bacterium]|nr:1-acyl-sn-glycerol-3-phosphate acyltransferase [Myxococcales bacterium]MCB9626532.1 1-acyl-sn-glycerol-3-phosphate acyltransferase [Sandaracinaceae bacterium]
MDKPKLSITLKTCGETLRICAPTMVEAAFGPVPRERCSARLAQWSAAAVRHADIETFAEGLEHVDTTRPHLVVSNHQSTYDIFLLMHLYPAELRMIAKKEMFRIPFLGPAMAAAEFVNIDRGDNARAREALEVARKRIESGINIWIAPEGTRSEDGRLLPFKTGGFMLALQTGIPILPVTVLGTQHVLPAKQVRVRPGKRAGVRFHPPVDPAAYGTARRDELMEHVRRTIDSGLPRELQSYSHT